jgi:hypothetical protein
MPVFSGFPNVFCELNGLGLFIVIETHQKTTIFLVIVYNGVMNVEKEVEL